MSTPIALPWEILLLVFNQSDPPTLAVLSRVSLDVLVACSTMLYRDVVVTSVKQLEGLFCERKEEKKEGSNHETSRITRHLSLSLLSTLTINFTSLSLSQQQQQQPVSALALSHLPHHPLPLQTLHLLVSHPSSTLLFPLLHTHLSPHLNPINFHATLLHPPHLSSCWINLNDATLPGWTRLETITLSGALPYGHGEGNVPLLGGLPAPTRRGGSRRNRTVRFEMDAFCEPTGASVGTVLNFIAVQYYVFGLEGMEEGQRRRLLLAPRRPFEARLPSPPTLVQRFGKCAAEGCEHRVYLTWGGQAVAGPFNDDGDRLCSSCAPATQHRIAVILTPQETQDIYAQLDASTTIKTLVQIARDFRGGSGITFYALLRSLRNAKTMLGGRWKKEVEVWLMTFASEEK
ncbi:hypothetical protein BDY24DRAFT_418349 [Mrakia frigida]|uniref:uncharacterized protein n=1 Tax=Mrakia frigida TaxID=29902 RepID=UPI003FCC16C0